MNPENNKPASVASNALTQDVSGKPLTATVFGYETPTQMEKSRAVIRLCRSDLVYANMTLIKSGGENNLHAHTANDGVWFVVKGRVKFYGIDDVLLAELGPGQGIHIPRGFFYWFESVGSELLELLQVEAIDKNVESRRLNMTPRKEGITQHLN